MCEAYQAPRPRVDVIASFAGPALYRELALTDKASMSRLKSLGALRSSLAMAGWNREVLESLESRDWLAVMGMMEELWGANPALTVLPRGTCAVCKIDSFYCGERLLWHCSSDAEPVGDRLAKLVEASLLGPLEVVIPINKRRKGIEHISLLLISVPSGSVDALAKMMHS
jgi:hypothetical protein